MNVFVSGLINIETTVKIGGFPLAYYPIDYPFFGISSNVSGVAYNVGKALMVLEDEIQIATYLGNDEEGKRIMSKLSEENLGSRYIDFSLKETPVTVALYDEEGKRQIHCDLKDIQDKTMDFSKVEGAVKNSDIVVLCNTNFNRALLPKVKETGKLIACDVHVLSNIEDAYNRDFMEYADILFLSDENLPCDAKQFALDLKEKYPPQIIVVGLGKKGAMLYDRKEDAVYCLAAANIGKVENTIGAGDALFSAFIHYYVKGYSPLEALKRAEIFATLKIRCNGASNGFEKEEIVEKYYENNSPKLIKY